MYWYIKVINQYSDFKSRSRRREYWMYTLFNIVFFLIAMILDNYIINVTIQGDLPIGIISVSYYFFILIPTVAVTVRRLHDIGKSGWYYFISFIPFVGGIWMILLMCMEGDMNSNKWGENPKID